MDKFNVYLYDARENKYELFYRYRQSSDTDNCVKIVFSVQVLELERDESFCRLLFTDAETYLSFIVAITVAEAEALWEITQDYHDLFYFAVCKYNKHCLDLDKYFQECDLPF